MSNPFKLLCISAGLVSIDDAAHFLDIKRQTCAKYWQGEWSAPPGIIQDLYDEKEYNKDMRVKMDNMTVEELTVFLGV